MAKQTYDCLIIGAGPAGLATATALARQQHTALVFDSRVYRNAIATHMHNFLGWDHRNPADLRKQARDDLLARYPSIHFHDTSVVQLRKLESGSFEALDDAGEKFIGRTVCLATGVKDLMPEIPGYAECWGRGIFHCLFCHGFEERGKASTGVLATDFIADSKMAVHLANMILRLSDKTTIYTNGNESLAEEVRGVLQRPIPRIKIDARKVVKFAMASQSGSEVVMTFEDGSTVTEGFLANHPNVAINGPFVQQLSLETNPSGEIKTTPPFNATSVPGVYACGDNATMMRSVVMASGMGSFAAVGIASQIQAEDLQSS
ncbi:FAD/NAD(P)-binding domain-containing protein [Thozetella sp. PMI_491]|nr:FAD/NAD(P)-binding domain-containing protein [Thozetella sp. PMI_491]